MLRSRIATLALVGLAAGVIAGCRAQPLVLYTVDTGQQRVWPHFVDQPMVLAFWSTDNLESFEALQALNTLTYRSGPIHVTGVAVSTDRAKINLWRHKEQVAFEVIQDPEARLAKKLGVKTYPTFILFDAAGDEVDRRLSIRTIHNWFDRPRWLRRVDPDAYAVDSAYAPAYGPATSRPSSMSPSRR